MAMLLCFVAVMLAMCASIRGQSRNIGVDCPEELRVCREPNTRRIKPVSYTIPQGFFKPSTRSNYNDTSYTLAHNKPVYVWKENTSIPWLVNGTGQLTDGKCGSQFFRSSFTAQPWVGWNPARFPGNSVSMFFHFNEPVAINSLAFYVLVDSNREVGYSYGTTFTTNDTSLDFVAEGISNNFSAWTYKGILETDIGIVGAVPKGFGNVLPSVSGSVYQLRFFGANDHWLLISEFLFCAQDMSIPPLAFPTSLPAVVEVVDTKTAILTCEVKNAVSLKLIREESGQVVERNVSTDANGYGDISLVWMVVANRVHAGLYRCQAIDARGFRHNHNFTVVLKNLPSPTADPTTPPPVAEFVDPKHEVVLIESDPVNVTCRARNAVSVGLINADTGTVIDKKTVGDPATDTTLVWSSEITNMRHAGRYRCEAADSRGILVSHNFTVVVKQAFVVTPAGPAKVTVGGLVLLQCCMQDNRISDTRSTADPKWSWERVLDGMKIVNSVPGKNYVLITNVKKEDAGEYVCEASAFGRRYTSTVTLEVDDESPMNPFEPHSVKLHSCSEEILTAGSANVVTPQATDVHHLTTVETKTNKQTDASTAGSDEDDMNTTVLILICVLAAIVLMLPVVLFCFLRQRRKYAKNTLYNQRELAVATPPLQNGVHRKTLPIIDGQSLASEKIIYQEIPETPSPVPATADGANLTVPDISVTGRSMSNASRGSRSPVDQQAVLPPRNGQRFKPYAKVDCTRPKSSHRAGHDDEGPYAESRVSHKLSESSVDLAPPALPPRLNSESSFSSAFDSPCTSPCPQLNLYDDPEDVRSQARRLSPEVSHTIIYEEPSINPEHMLGTGAAEESLKPLNAIYEEPPPLSRDSGPLEIEPSQLNLRRKIGDGQFGEVYMAMMYPRDVEGQTPQPPRPVALKILKASASSDLVEAFEKEVKFMWRLDHPNVVRLIGVRTKEEPCMVIEHMANGDLFTYLSDCKLSLNGGGVAEHSDSTHVTLSNLVHMAQQVASGMAYMSRHAYVHRDLAARNCLVDADGCVKLGDFGLSRHLYEKQYYKVTGRAVLPIRWMAPESFYGRFSVQSDVFSFGITIWEIFTLCRDQPFSDYSDNELIQITMRSMNSADSKRRPTPPIPVYCPEKVESLMQRCWRQKPCDRPTFNEISDELTTMLQD